MVPSKVVAHGEGMHRHQTKKRQQNDINLALARWQDYKQRKKTGEK
jgi:hypothetical protein